MESSASADPAALLRKLTWPVAAAVVAVVGLAWYLTWATSDLTMGVLMAPTMAAPSDLAVAFLLLTVMMVAMMLPSALPMVVTYHELSRLENGEPTRAPDRAGTAAFGSAYFVVWGAFALAALAGLALLGILGPLTGWLGLLPAAVLLAAGAWQVTRTKEVCLSHCQSPLGFVMQRWRAGWRGAWRMGAEHAVYCIGCCWLFMLVLFVTGAMSLVWMGAIALAIFAEKIGWRPALVSRGIGALLVAAGILLVLPVVAAL